MMSPPSRCGLPFLVVLALGASPAPGADILSWTNNRSGNWNMETNWVQMNVPDSVTEYASVIRTGSSTGPFSVTNNGTMYPGGLTIAGMVLGDPDYALATRAMYLFADDLDWTLGEAGSPGTFITRYAYAEFNQVNLAIQGSLTNTAMSLNYSSQNKEWSLVATNSTITISNGVAKIADTDVAALLLTGNYADKIGATTAGLKMSGGSLTVVNSTTNAAIQVQGGSVVAGVTSRVARLWLKDTTLTTDKLFLSSAANFRFDCGAAAGPSHILNELRFHYGGGKADLISGDLTIGKVAVIVNTTDTNLTPNIAAFLNVTGAAVTVRGNLEWSSGAFHNNYAPWEIKVWSGSVSANNILIGGKNVPRGQYALYLYGGDVAVSNDLWLGWYSTTTRHGSGLLEMSGGTLSCGSLLVGRASNADGYFMQSGGTATIRNTLTLLTESATYGTRQFVVSSNATMILTGSGFVKNGATAWAESLLTPANLDFSGTFTIDPAPGVTNISLLAFGRDAGRVRDGLSLPYAMGTLEVSALDGDERLTILAAGNETTNGLYVARLPGLTPAAAADHLNSALTVYFDPDASPLLGRDLSLNLNGGGRLVALPSRRTPGAVFIVR